MSAPAALVDPRGLRFSAALTSIVLAVAIIAPSPQREILLALQAVIFAQAAFASPQNGPYARLFIHVVSPRLGPPRELEDARPPRFAQQVGLSFVLVSLALLLTGFATAGVIVAGFALVAALLNALFGLCLGCEAYLLGRRVTSKGPIQRTHRPASPIHESL